MNPHQRKALILDLASRLRDCGNWCGETHIQKTTYFAQELLGLPLDFEFVMYIHGPFSFELRDELTELRADGLLELHPRPTPYGPSLAPTQASRALMDRFPKTIGRYAEDLDFLTTELCSMGVASLERLSTILYARNELKTNDRELLTHRVNELKQHISLESARAYVDRFFAIVDRGRKLLPQS